MNALLAVIAAGVASYALRYSSILVLTRWRLPPRAERALGYAAPAAVGALLATTLRAQLPALDPAQAGARVLAIGLAAIVVARTKSPSIAMLVALPAVWISAAIF
jgi:branched-subunit amino acid transport protein